MGDTKQYTNRLNCNDPEGAYLCGRFEAWEELIGAIRTATKLLRTRNAAEGERVAPLVEDMLRGIVEAHDRMVHSIEADKYSPGANECAKRHGESIDQARLVELLGPIGAMDDPGDISDLDPALAPSHENPFILED